MAKSNYYKTKEAPPYYKKSGAMRQSTTFNLRNVPGVYLIYKNDRLVYCGFSKTNVYKTLYRHFQEWGTSNQVRTVYTNLKGITCRVIYCKNGNQASRLEKAIIIKHKPKDNQNKYDLYTTDKKEEEIYNIVTGEPEKDIIYNQEADPF